MMFRYKVKHARIGALYLFMAGNKDISFKILRLRRRRSSTLMGFYSLEDNFPSTRYKKTAVLYVYM